MMLLAAQGLDPAPDATFQDLWWTRRIETETDDV
jgi:hypothetical protein